MATKKITEEEKVEVKTPVEAPVEVQPETVSVEAAVLQKILDKVESLEKDNEALKASVSKTRLEEAQARTGVDNRKRYHFKLLNGKVVIGWPEKPGEDKKNEILINPNTNSPMGEVLKCRYYFIDGSKSDMIDQTAFSKINDLVYAREVERQGSDLVLEMEDKNYYDKQFVVNTKFVNA